MNLLRIILIAAAIWIIFTITRNYLRNRSIQRRSPPGKIGTMVRCHYCGLHIPENEATLVDENYYCSEEHSRLSARDD